MLKNKHQEEKAGNDDAVESKMSNTTLHFGGLWFDSFYSTTTTHTHFQSCPLRSPPFYPFPTLPSFLPFTFLLFLLFLFRLHTSLPLY